MTKLLKLSRWEPCTTKCFFNVPTPASFFLIFVLFKQNFFSFFGIRIRIVGVEGEHADHFATITAQERPNFCLGKSPVSFPWKMTTIVCSASNEWGKSWYTSCTFAIRSVVDKTLFILCCTHIIFPHRPFYNLFPLW